MPLCIPDVFCFSHSTGRIFHWTWIKEGRVLSHARFPSPGVRRWTTLPPLVWEGVIVHTSSFSSSRGADPIVDYCLVLPKFSASLTRDYDNCHVRGCFAISFGCSPSYTFDHRVSRGPSYKLQFCVAPLLGEATEIIPASLGWFQRPRETGPAPGSASMGEALGVDESWHPPPCPGLPFGPAHAAGWVWGPGSSGLSERCRIREPSHGRGRDAGGPSDLALTFPTRKASALLKPEEAWQRQGPGHSSHASFPLRVFKN